MKPLVVLMIMGLLLFSTGCQNAPESAQTVLPLPPAEQAQPIPLLLGSWADPSILRAGGDYYMTQSTCGGYVPAMLIWHSTDLLNWKPLGYAIHDRPAGLAPDLAFVNNIFYLYCERTTAFTASSPAGPWTDHGHMEGSRGIDPGHFAGFDGQRYLYSSGGHYSKLSDDGLSYVEGPEQVYEGWEIPRDWAIEGMYLESPKIFKKEDWYYMVSAQGGTFGPMTAHMAVVARSKDPKGPWENCPYNPVIRTWDHEDPWWTQGHATFFEGPGGNWFALYHGYKNGYRLMGRSTLLLPIAWTAGGWPVVAAEWPEGFSEEAVNIDLPLSDEFDGSELGLQWQSPREHDLTRYRFEGGALVVNGRGESVGDSVPITFNARHIAYQVETEVELAGAASAGITLYYTTDAYVSIGLTEDGLVERGYAAGSRRPVRTDEHKYSGKKIRLKFVNDKNDVRCYFMNEDGEWVIIQSSVDVTFMDDNGFSRNSALRPGLFATGGGSAAFSYIRYEPYENRQYEEHFGNLVQ